MKEEKEKGSISNFQAISAVLAGNLGPGNISGMAIAISVGGPGSLFWMWIMAILGMVIKYVGCFLGFKYRIKNKEKEYVGGPMYYLSSGMKNKFMGVLFSIFCIFTAITAGNFVQINSISLPLARIGVSPILIGIILAIFVAFVIFGGLLRFARVVEVLVPFKALFYLVFAVFILILYKERVLPALSLVFSSAFKPTALSGGFVGYGFLYAVRVGFQRGIFATDAGIGIAPILQSGAREKNSILEGFVAMIAPLVVMIVCSITILVLIVTDAWTNSGMKSTNMCVWAFKKGLSSNLGEYVVIISLISFAFTSILAWSVAGGKAMEFLFGSKNEKFFKYIFILIVPIGTILQVDLVWLLADIGMALMLIINVIGITALFKKVSKDTLAFKKE
jgi:AGCS family alanine or glycine:cation symporter